MKILGTSWWFLWSNTLIASSQILLTNPKKGGHFETRMPKLVNQSRRIVGLPELGAGLA